jgi:multicomponent Na+:H+ antiporter subunit E
VFFVSRLLGTNYYADLTLPFILRFPRFSLGLFWEIIKANIDVALIILNPRLPIDPRIFKLPVRLKGDLPRSVYAASINLTPGTVVVEIQDDFFLVHALAARHESGLVNGQVEEVVARLFGQELRHVEEEVTIA